MSNVPIKIRSDPATYRLIEVLFGQAKDFNGNTVQVSKAGDVYVYFAGDNICTASPGDYAPSNTSWIIYAPAQYSADGTVVGSFVNDVDRNVTEIGLVLFTAGTKVLLAKTCLAQPIHLSPGQEFKATFQFVLQ
jgi:hypothetical protein